MGETKERLLVVDDAIDTLELLQRNLRSQGYEVLTAANVAEALRILGTVHVNLVITDLKMPGASGLDLVRYVRENLKQTEIMMITGYPSIEGAVAAVKVGAEEYLAKPFTKEELFSAVRLVLDKLKQRQAAGARPERIGAVPYGIVGDCDAIQKVIRAIASAADRMDPVMIVGEKGTGKELVARAIHYSSKRVLSPVITVNCTGVPIHILEKQLFGTPAEAARGETRSQPGLFRLAAGGTLYLKEITELPQPIQATLLRMMEQAEPRSPGSAEARAPDFALIADSSRDVRVFADSGRLRVDLFVRLSMSMITLPPLRERGNDVLLLARHFLDKFTREVGKPAPGFTDRLCEVMRHYPWPGNVAEVEGLMHHLASTIPAEVIDVPDLPAHMRYMAATAISLKRSLAEVEAEHIRDVVASVGGNKTRAVEILGINRKTLREKLRQPGHPRTGTRRAPEPPAVE